MFRRIATMAGLLALAVSTLPADFSYEETSTVTGGMMAGVMKFMGTFSKKAAEPAKSTIAVKGGRMLHRSAYRASIVDLGSETITSIDFQKKTYSVMTFEEMNQALEQMAAKMKQNDKAQMNFKVSAKATGNTRQVAGFNAKEMVLKMEMEGTDANSGQKGGMLITTDMWLASGIAGYHEVREFHKRMAEKLNWTPSGNMFMSQPNASKGMAELYKEAAKVEGVPVLQTVAMGATGQPGAAPADGGNSQQQQQAQQQQPPPERPSLGGALGRLGGFGRKKQDSGDQQQGSQGAQAGGSSGGAGSLLEMTIEASGFSDGPVDPSQFEVPAGFKKVEPDLKRVR